MCFNKVAGFFVISRLCLAVTLYGLENPPKICALAYALLKYSKMKQERDELEKILAEAAEKLNYCLNLHQNDPGVLCVLVFICFVKNECLIC